jgi:F-type H+-transporting ATPase subunit gamma
MQLVAASKLRRAQEAALAPVAYNHAARELLGHLSTSAGVLNHPLYERRPVKRALTVVIAADRGLAGAYNGNVLRALTAHVTALGVPHQAISVGRQAALHTMRTHNVSEAAVYTMDNEQADTGLAQPILTEVTQLFERHEVDMVHVIYTHFVSTVKSEVKVVQLLPVTPVVSNVQASELEPSPEVLIDVATRTLLEAQLLQAVLEARASEQAARMLAMLNATDNAGELIKSLNLAYNNARQAAITQELAEITAGAEATNG